MIIIPNHSFENEQTDRIISFCSPLIFCVLQSNQIVYILLKYILKEYLWNSIFDYYFVTKTMKKHRQFTNYSFFFCFRSLFPIAAQMSNLFISQEYLFDHKRV